MPLRYPDRLYRRADRKERDAYHSRRRKSEACPTFIVSLLRTVPRFARRGSTSAAVLCLAAVAVCACGGSPPQAYVSLTGPVGGRYVARPNELVFSVDGDLVAQGLSWSHWGSDATTGRGRFIYRSSSGNATVIGTVALSDPVRCRARAYYKRATVTAPGGPFTPRGSIPFATPC